MNIDTATLALAISLLSAVISFWNVSRQKNANLKNDTEKFKRDLNLKTADEFIEVLFDSKKVINRISHIDTDYYAFVSGKVSWEDLNNCVWEIIEADSKTLHIIESMHSKRVIILENYSATIKDIRRLYDEIWNVAYYVKRLMHREDHPDDEVGEQLEIITSNSTRIVEHIEVMIERVQYEFLGEIYDK